MKRYTTPPVRKPAALYFLALAIFSGSALIKWPAKADDVLILKGGSQRCLSN